MKKLLLLFAPMIFLFSCNTEMSAEQYRAQNDKQCLKQLTKDYLDEDASDADKAKFCDCYADHILDGQETITVKEMIQRATKIEELGNAMTACKDAIGGDEMEEKEMMDKPAE